MHYSALANDQNPNKSETFLTILLLLHQQ